MIAGGVKLNVIWDGVHLFKTQASFVICVGLISLIHKAILNGPYLLSIKTSTLLEVDKIARYKLQVRLCYAVL